MSTSTKGVTSCWKSVQRRYHGYYRSIERISRENWPDFNEVSDKSSQNIKNMCWLSWILDQIPPDCSQSNKLANRQSSHVSIESNCRISTGYQCLSYTGYHELSPIDYHLSNSITSQICFSATGIENYLYLHFPASLLLFILLFRPWVTRGIYLRKSKRSSLRIKKSSPELNKGFRCIEISVSKTLS